MQVKIKNKHNKIRHKYDKKQQMVKIDLNNEKSNDFLEKIFKNAKKAIDFCIKMSNENCIKFVKKYWITKNIY